MHSLGTLLLLAGLCAAVTLACAAPFAAAEDAAVTPASGVAFTVDGASVLVADIEAEVEYKKGYAPMPAAQLRLEVVSSFALQAFIKSQSAEAYKTMEATAAQALERLGKGEKWDDVCKALSDDDQTKPSGGSLGSFGRGQMVPPFERLAFTTPEGQYSQPFLTVFGIHIVYVEKCEKGETPEKDKVTAKHMLFMFDKSDPRAYIQSMQNKFREAKIEVVDPMYADYLYIAPAGTK